jgi:hypothetical protein
LWRLELSDFSSDQIEFGFIDRRYLVGLCHAVLAQPTFVFGKVSAPGLVAPLFQLL